MKVVPRRPLFLSLLALSASLLGLGFVACSRTAPPSNVNVPLKATVVEDLNLYKARPIGLPLSGHPWIAHVLVCDLDKDGMDDIIVSDCRENRVQWIRQVSPGQYEETTLCPNIPAPVHVEAVDMNGDGHLDLLVSVMGEVFPCNDKIGQVLIYENDGHQHFKKHVIAEGVYRVNDIKAADFNGDGKLDLAIGQFGYDQGAVQWMENKGNWNFEMHMLLELSGDINVCVADFDGDGNMDVTAQISQQYEEIYLFSGNGKGGFTTKKLWGSTNEDFASSGMVLCDLNKDGKPDLLFSNGDGFGPSALPGPRPWHGVQWLENKGHNEFVFHRIGDLYGGYSPVEVDLDGDGNLDVLAVSGFNDWDKPKAQSLVWYRNDGKMNFTPHVLAYRPTHLLTIATGHFDGTKRPSIVSGAFHSYPPYNRMSRIMLWTPQQ